MLNHIHMRTLINPMLDAVPDYNFTFALQPDEDDPLSPTAWHHRPLDSDTLELFRGPLMHDTDATRTLLGRVRQPCWILLSAGVVMRSHVCNATGSAFMDFSEAQAVVPRLRGLSTSQRVRARRAWDVLIGDLEALGVQPVVGETVTSAWDIWEGAPMWTYGGVLPHGSSAARSDMATDLAAGPRLPCSAPCDGVTPPSRDTLDALVARLADGDTAAAEEWEAAYRSWADTRAPRAQCERDMATPTWAERHGPHTRYRLPPQHGVSTMLMRGREPPAPLPGDDLKLAAYAEQRWRVAKDGRSLTCARSTALADASVIVQLYARALPLVVVAYDKDREVKDAKRRRYEYGCAKRGEVPRPVELTPEEASWDGGPGFNVALANLTMNALLRDEVLQGYAYTAAAVGDGSWDKRSRRVSRGALLHDGTVLGGALECEDVVGGDRNNYDGELAHRLDVLHALSRREDVRLLYLYDSTSPIIAGEHFRRSTTSARARFECDDWQGSAMAFEQLLDSVTYWWYKSHCGHLPEAAADDLAKNYLQDDPTPLPHAPSRHVALRFYAKRSERDLMLATANLSLVRRTFALGDAICPTVDQRDALRAAKLCERDQVLILLLRDDRAKLQVSKVYPNARVGIL